MCESVCLHGRNNSKQVKLLCIIVLWLHSSCCLLVWHRRCPINRSSSPLMASIHQPLQCTEPVLSAANRVIARFPGLGLGTVWQIPLFLQSGYKHVSFLSGEVLEKKKMLIIYPEHQVFIAFIMKYLNDIALPYLEMFKHGVESQLSFITSM